MQVDPDARLHRFIPARAGNTADMASPSDPCAIGSSPLARGTRSTARPPTPSPVHPRSRGEHGIARGVPVYVAVRFIPARAGNTDQAEMDEDVSPVHPRSRGEHKAPAMSWRRSAVPVHPRSRGEHLNPRSHSGSSPLARTIAQGSSVYVAVRFIPARAGNTCATWTATRIAGSSPLARGKSGWPWLRAVGSSPLARGTPQDYQRTLQRQPAGSSPLARGTRSIPPTRTMRWQRFIPARAGNTGLSSACRARLTAVHPRSRGEHDTANARPTRIVTPVHPRSRGEHSMSAATPAAWSVSSVHPRSRGEHRSPTALTRPKRFIPARAGNTRSARIVAPDPGGSSPLARGTLQATLSVQCAGSSPLARGHTGDHAAEP